MDQYLNFVLRRFVVFMLLIGKVAQSASGPKFTGTPISLADYLAGNLSGASIETIWLQEKLLAYKDSHQNLWTLEIGLGVVRRKLLSDNSPFKETDRPKASLWVPSFNTDYIAFGYGAHRLYRYSVLAFYNISFMQDGDRKVDYPVHIRKIDSVNRGQKLRLFQWNPVGDDFVFVFENNIYYRSKPEDVHTADAIQITSTGTADNDNVINGVADWLYEEEILGEEEALWWSNDGMYLAFATFNNTLVRRMTFDYYPHEGLYPEERSIAYPKVGEKIPTVTLSVWNKATKKVVPLLPPSEVQKLGEYYLFSVTWPKIKSWKEAGGEPTLMAVWANRVQNATYISLCSMASGSCILTYPQNADLQNFGGVWVEPDDFKLSYAADNRYFAILSSLEPDGYFYKHVAAVGVPANGRGGTVDFLTEGLFEVTDIVGYNAEKSLLFFTAAHPLPRQNHLFSVSTSPVNRSSIQCITCWMSDVDGCNSVKADFSDDGEFFVLTCKGPGVPQTLLRNVFINQTLFAIEDNTQLREYIATKALPVVKYETIPLADGYEALARILYPPGFDSADTEAAYPLLQRVYAGPGTQYVQETWFSSIGFETFLASGRRYIVALIDGRGTGMRGTKYKKPIYRNMGVYEVRDQISAGSILENRSHYVDKDRMAVWGWSYGGFVSASMVEHGAHKVYRCAVSVAPVTNFRYYDAAYTERYNGLFTDPGGEEAYRRTNLTADVSNFRHIKYLLVHGTADDNVHFQHSAMLAAALTDRNIQFKYMVYTNEAHSISGDRLHLYTMLDKFFHSCLKEKSESEESDDDDN